jgi:hypothetical protein
MTSLRTWWLPLALAFTLGGCAINRESASAAPDADLARLQRIHVVRSPQDTRGVDVAIAERLRHEARYTAQCTDRTFTWPGETLIAGVVQTCLKALGAKVRADTALAAVVEGR